MKQIQEILDQEITRQEFFKLAGASALAVLGVTGLLQNLTSIFSSQKTAAKPANNGYGNSPYGI